MRNVSVGLAQTSSKIGNVKDKMKQHVAFMKKAETERADLKMPSPALWEGQTAESELGIDYPTLDRILYRRFDLRWGAGSIAVNLKTPISKVERILDQVRRTQHKRYPPEILKLGFRSHGLDWRYPREWS